MRRWRVLTPEELARLKDLQRRTFDAASAKEDGLRLSPDGSLCAKGRAVRIEAGTVEEFAKALEEAFPAQKALPKIKNMTP